MATTSNNNNIESKNRVINYDIEIVRDFDGTYYVNARNELHEHIKGLPEYLPYKELKKAVKEALGVTLPPLKSLTFEGNGRKQYADAYGLQGVEIHQEPLAFGLQDKVILGSFGESRPYAISCTVTGYRWDSEAGEFLYILQGEDGKEYTDFARNIIHDPKAERQERYEARCKELEAEALAQMPYKVGDTVKSRDGVAGRVIEMHPEITGDIDSPHLIYEYDGKPTVNVVILDTNGKRHCAHWSVFTLEPAPEIKAIDVLQVGTMVRMPGIIGGLRVKEIDRKGDRVICVDGCKERHTYKGLDYFTATAEEICIPEWLRICQYFYIGPKGVERNRVLCTDIIPCSDQEKPVVIVYSDHEGKERKIFLSPGLDSVNRTDRERLTAKYREQIVNNMQLGCGCIVTDGDEDHKDSKCVKVWKAYTNNSNNPEDWMYCVAWYNVEPTEDGNGYREKIVERENSITIDQAARHMAYFELMAAKGWTLNEILYGKAA